MTRALVVAAPASGSGKTTVATGLMAALDVVLSDDEIAALEEPYVPHPILGH